jgi:hypothetical protein
MSGRYGLALVLLILALVYTMAMDEGERQRLLALTLQGLALFVTMMASRADRRVLFLLTLVFVSAFAGAAGLAVFTSGDGTGYVRICFLATAAATLPVVAMGLIRQVKSEGRITVQTMMGVLCAYLLIMSVFAYSYAVIGEFGDGPFFNQGEQWNQIGNYLYYSLITITTVGMGDFTAATQLGRSLTAAEALVGQIYMVTVVAVIVTNLGRSRRPKAVDSAPVGAEATKEGSPDG